MDNRGIKRWVGSVKGRLSVVALVLSVAYLLGNWSPAPRETGLVGIVQSVLIGLLLAALLFVLLALVAVVSWIVVGLVWNLLTWVRTGEGSGYFDHDPFFGFRKHGNG